MKHKKFLIKLISHVIFFSLIFFQFVGTYNTYSNSWTTIRTLEVDTLTKGSLVSTIVTRIALDVTSGISNNISNEF